jgi:hypothetical protein
MGTRHPTPRLAKIHRCYSVDEVSRLFKIHKNTARNWLRQGLTAIDNQRPTLIRGEELRRFLVERRARTKQACGPGRIYCLPCRAPKVPAGKMAECVATSDTTGTLRGVCPDCDRMIYRTVNPQKIASVRGDLDVAVTQAGARLSSVSDRPGVGKTAADHINWTFAPNIHFWTWRDPCGDLYIDFTISKRLRVLHRQSIALE